MSDYHCLFQQPSYALAFQPLTGGLVLGSGGLGIPIRKCSPVAFLFQRTLWFIGWLNVIAPSNGQAFTQPPPYQHSSGYRIIGGLPFSGLGMSMSMGHISTQLLQPLQISSSNITGLFGVIILGYICTSSCSIMVTPLHHIYPYLHYNLQFSW